MRLSLRMMPVTIVYFCYGWTLWLYLNWLPSFFLHEYRLDLGHSALFASAVFSAGVAGDVVGGVMSDRILERTGDLQKARRNVVVAGFLGSFLCPAADLRDARAARHRAVPGGGALLRPRSSSGRCGRSRWTSRGKFSGTAAGLMNTGSALAAILSPLAFGYVADLTGDWHLPFVGSVGLLLLGAALSFTMHPERAFVEQGSSPPRSR